MLSSDSKDIQEPIMKSDILYSHCVQISNDGLVHLYVASDGSLWDMDNSALLVSSPNQDVQDAGNIFDVDIWHMFPGSETASGSVPVVMTSVGMLMVDGKRRKRLHPLSKGSWEPADRRAVAAIEKKITAL